MDTFSPEFLMSVFTGSFWIVTAMTTAWWLGISFLAVFFSHRALQHWVRSLSAENQLRLAFFLVPSVLLFTLVAINRPVFPLALYMIVAGAFLGALWETSRVFRLVEPNSTPSKDQVDLVLSYHRNVKPHPTPKSKNFFDRIFSVVCMIVLSPIFLFCAIAVWMNDPGPMIVATVAVGKNGRPFRKFKLRTMIKDAEKHTGAIQSHRGDERIIFIGHFLRASHLDELPQLWNVLKGEMSLVGPRPEKVVRVTKFLQDVPNYAQRHTVLPGITGWAQIHHTYYTPPGEKIVFDMHYIRHQSIALDLKILWRTLPATAEELSSADSEK